MNDATSPGNDDLELPEVIIRYQNAHDRHDTDGALSAFTPDARVVDENREYRGSDEIRHWLEPQPASSPTHGPSSAPKPRPRHVARPQPSRR